jgi:hypothetical protein
MDVNYLSGLLLMTMGHARIHENVNQFSYGDMSKVFSKVGHEFYVGEGNREQN